MAHKLETAQISFGLGTNPVGIYSAIQEATCGQSVDRNARTTTPFNIWWSCERPRVSITPGVSMQQIRKVLNSLQRQLGEGEVLSSLKIYASGKRVVVWGGRSRWQPDSGQFLLNFETTCLDGSC